LLYDDLSANSYSIPMKIGIQLPPE